MIAVAHLCRGREFRGGERQVRLLIETLDRHPSITQYLLTGRATRLGSSIAHARATLVPLPWRAGLDPRAMVTAVAHLTRLRSRHQAGLVLHAHDSHALAVAAFAGRLLGVPVVATRRSESRPGRLWRLPDRVIAISGAVESALAESGVDRTRIVRIPSAVPTMNGSGTDTQPRSGQLIASAGALSTEKGHDTLLHALALVRQRHPAASLVLVGDGPERPRLQRLAHRLGIADAVTFLGDRPDAAREIRAARVLAQPSRREALGTAVLEAMALGTPVVGSAVGGLPELLGNDAGLLVPPGDPERLAAALGRILIEPGLADQLARNASSRVASYHAHGVAERVAGVYRSAQRTG